MCSLDNSRSAAPTKIGLSKKSEVFDMLTRVRFSLMILNSLKFGFEIRRLDCFGFVANLTSDLSLMFSTDFPYI